MEVLSMKSSAEKIAMKSYEDIFNQPTQRGNRLLPMLCHLISFTVDVNHLSFNPDVAISYLDAEQQLWLKELMKRTQSSPLWLKRRE
jgi:hypothetical protein